MESELAALETCEAALGGVPDLAPARPACTTPSRWWCARLRRVAAGSSRLDGS